MAIDEIVETLAYISSMEELERARTIIDNRLVELEKEEKEEEEKEIIEDIEEEIEED